MTLHRITYYVNRFLEKSFQKDKIDTSGGMFYYIYVYEKA